MIRSTILAAATAALALSGSAAAAPGPADPAFDAFRTICAGASGDYLAVLKAADAAGWRETQVVPPTDQAVSVTDQAAREIVLSGDELTLLANRGLQHMQSGDVPENTCRIQTTKPHPDAIDAAKTWLGMSPDGGDATLAYFIVTGPPDKLIHVSSTTIPPGGVSIIKVQLDSGSVLFFYQHFASK